MFIFRTRYIYLSIDRLSISSELDTYITNLIYFPLPSPRTPTDTITWYVRCMLPLFTLKIMRSLTLPPSLPPRYRTTLSYCRPYGTPWSPHENQTYSSPYKEARPLASNFRTGLGVNNSCTESNTDTLRYSGTPPSVFTHTHTTMTPPSNLSCHCRYPPSHKCKKSCTNL